MTQVGQEHCRTDCAGVERAKSAASFGPDVDIIEREDALLLLADLPGTSAEKVDIDLENGKLTIRGRVEARQPEGTGYLLREYGVGDFVRTFEVGDQIDPAGISAEYLNGVLRVTLPKATAAKPVKIAVKAS